MHIEPTKDPRRQWQGAQANANSREFEAIIAAACEWYSDNGIAEIEKNPEPMRILGRQQSGRFTACFEKAAQPDYKGTLYGGKAIAFEAKSTTTERLEHSRITSEQAERLNRHTALGATCFILASFDSVLFYRIPWEDWTNIPPKLFTRRKYLTTAELEPYRISRVRGILQFLTYEEQGGTLSI
jgi:recombination protein U